MGARVLLRRLALSLALFVAHFETVPRWVELPRLGGDDLKPP